jgi:hypothetical protein
LLVFIFKKLSSYFKILNRIRSFKMTFNISKTLGKELSPETKDDHNSGALKSRGLTIDHVIILIVVIALSITIINTYTKADSYQETIKGSSQHSTAQVNHTKS